MVARNSNVSPILYGTLLLVVKYETAKKASSVFVVVLTAVLKIFTAYRFVAV
jgi:hypothetical protein